MRKQLCQFFNLVKPFNLVMYRDKDWKNVNKKIAAYEKIFEIYTMKGHSQPVTYSCIVFSKDRALQLHSLLCSLREKISTPVKLFILYATSSGRHADAYNQVLSIHQKDIAVTIHEISFRDQLIELLGNIDTDRLFFLVDDIVILREISFGMISGLSTISFVPSLRMAPHLDYCYTFAQKQSVPKEIENIISSNEFFCWRWKDGVFDWRYPLSLDGNIFDTGEIKSIIESCSFKAPNSLESALQEYLPIFLPRYGICWKKSRIINIPLNKVQEENNNVCGGCHQDELLKYWENGFEIDYERFFDIVNRSTHQEVDIYYKKRLPSFVND